MPELPEVETIVQDLRGLVVGRRVDRVSVTLNKVVRTGPRRLARLAHGRVIAEVGRRGKFIIIALDDGSRIVVHLKMTGQFLLGPAPTKRPKHVHVVFFFEDGEALMFRDMRQFGYMLGLSPEEFEAWSSGLELGPEPFDLSPREFAALLAGRRGRIKPLLLNQCFISGLGNIYVDESLFAAGIHPACPADAVPEEQAARLHERMCSILEEAIGLRGSTTSDYVGLRGVGGEFQNRHQVYGKKGENCPRCGLALTRCVVGGRGTHLCECCQPAPKAGPPSGPKP